jgi:hypothetical protein
MFSHIGLILRSMLIWKIGFFANLFLIRTAIRPVTGFSLIYGTEAAIDMYLESHPNPRLKDTYFEFFINMMPLFEELTESQARLVIFSMCLLVFCSKRFPKSDQEKNLIRDVTLFYYDKYKIRYHSSANNFMK